MKKPLMKRRQLLSALVSAAAAGAASTLVGRRTARAAGPGARFLIVLPAFGGGAIIDSFLPVRAGESANPTTLDCFPDDQVKDVSGSPIRAVDAVCGSILGISLGASPITVPLSPFAQKHHAEMMVTTLECTSVNHAIAQRRALSGGGAWGGRTLQELVALAYGEGLALPSVNMASLGYLERGGDPTLPAWAYAEPVPEAILKPLSLSATRGMPAAPDAALVDRARVLRDTQLDPPSGFHRAFRKSARLALWQEQREAGRAIEQEGLIDKLLFLQDQPGIPLEQYGLSSAPEAAELEALFPDWATDPLEQQAMLTCLLIKNRVSATVTLSPGMAPITGGPFLVKNLPLAFDGSHQDHRSTQALMWLRVTSIADRISDFLKGQIFDEDTGETFWDRTMIHLPTDFGRSKARPEDAVTWGTAHDLSNGHLTLSPLVRGNAVLGGVDPDTGRTFGFDLETGDADPGRRTAEAESFAGLLGALGIDLGATGLPDVPAMREG